MINPLYIVWKDEFNLDIPILDEQHHAIVATINSLYFFIQEGWGLAALTPTLKIIKTYRPLFSAAVRRHPVLHRSMGADV